MCVIGIFKDRKQGDCFWLEDLDEYEMKSAIALLDSSFSCGCHYCEKSNLYDNMEGYVDQVQNEYELDDNEIYVVIYYKFTVSDGLTGCIDFGMTKTEIIDNVKSQKYVEGATYFTIGNLLYSALTINKQQYGNVNAIEGFGL